MQFPDIDALASVEEDDDLPMPDLDDSPNTPHELTCVSEIDF